MPPSAGEGLEAQRIKILWLRKAKSGVLGHESNSPTCDMDFIFYQNGSWTCAEKKTAQVSLVGLELPDGLCHQAASSLQCYKGL